MKFFLKLTASIFLAITVGLVSAYVSLVISSKSGGVSNQSQNPYKRAAYASRDILPNGSGQ